MGHEKPDVPNQHDSLPIPTYDEAISSRPSSSQSFLGPQEISHDAERQGLLGRRDGSNNLGYRPPTAQSVRSSFDDLASLAGSSREGSTDNLRRELQQMDIDEPSPDEHSRLHLLTSNRLSKRITSLTHSLSSLHLPFREWLPSWDYIRAKADRLSFGNFAINWILIFRLLALLVVILIVYVLFFSSLLRMRGGTGRGPADPELVRAFIADNVQTSSIRKLSQDLTLFNHMAGTDGGREQVKFIESFFKQAQLEEVQLEQFNVYLNFPKEGGRRVAIIQPATLAWEALIEENPGYGDGRPQALAFHGHSKSGNVTGPLIVRSHYDIHKNTSLTRA